MRLRGLTGAWLSRLLWHPARKRSGSILNPGIQTGEWLSLQMWTFELCFYSPSYKLHFLSSVVKYKSDGGGGGVVVRVSDMGLKGPRPIPGGAKKWMHVCKYLPLLSCFTGTSMRLNQLAGWTITVVAFPDIAGPHLPIPGDERLSWPRHNISEQTGIHTYLQPEGPTEFNAFWAHAAATDSRQGISSSNWACTVGDQRQTTSTSRPAQCALSSIN